LYGKYSHDSNATCFKSRRIVPSVLSFLVILGIIVIIILIVIFGLKNHNHNKQIIEKLNNIGEFSTEQNKKN
jgi:hypothetical protein